MIMKIVHIINSLEFGGAEIMLCGLLSRMDRERYEPVVVLLIDDLTLADRVIALDVPIRVVGIRAGVPDPRRFAALVKLLRRERPIVVQTWMDHSNLIGGLAARLATNAPVVWGVHHSNHVRDLTKRTTLLTVSACARLSSRIPARIVCCSEHARSNYARDGFCEKKMLVIPNGFDTDAFRPDAAARLDVRRELGLGPDALLIGLVARHDPLKDHQNFLRAAGIIRDAFKDVHFLLCGDRVDDRNPALVSAIHSLGISERCHLLGPRRDVARIQASLDIATSSSLSEAFPLAVGEAMSCGVPCVVTDVGDSALMVGETGRVVPARDSAALALAWKELLELPAAGRRLLGQAARQRSQELYDLTAVTRRYEQIYEQVRPRDHEAKPALALELAAALDAKRIRA
jgi:glycosyltransferase involved in cell wall biosynthesis